MPGRRKPDIDPAVAAQQLAELVLKKSFPEADDLLARVAKIEYITKTGEGEELKLRTVLHLCVEAGNLEALEWTASKGANPNTAMEQGTTALHLCVSQDKAAVLQKLCDLNAAGAFRFTLDVNKRNTAGESALQGAIHLNKVDLAKILLKAGAVHDFNERCFTIEGAPPGLQVNHMQYACCKGNLELVETLNELGVTPFQRDTEGSTLVHLTVRYKQWVILEWLLDKGCSLNAQGLDGRTVLSTVLAEGWGPESIGQLIQKGANINEPDADGTPLLHHAILQGDEALVGVLLDNSATSVATDMFDNTAAHIAAQLPSKSILQRIMTGDEKKNGEVVPNAVNAAGDTPLHTACQMDQPQNVAYLLSLPGTNQNLQNGRGCVALHLAAAYGSAECAKHVLDHNADKGDEPVAKKPPPKGKKDAAPADDAKKTEIELEDSEGNTPLQVAMEYGHSDVVKLLIECQASVQRNSQKHGTLLHQAVFCGAHDIMQSLVAGGASVHERDQNDLTPLHIAVETGCVDSVTLLLQSGATVTCQDEHRGRTPLHEAAARGLHKIVAVLLKHKAAVGVRDHTCMTPLHHASACGSFLSAGMLLDAGANANAIDTGYRTPLHCACLSNHTATTKLLLSRGADITAKDSDGWAPLHTAAASGSVESARLLVGAGASITEADRHDRIPLTLASESCRVEVARLLVSSWATRKQGIGA